MDTFKNCIFGLVVVLWGLSLLFFPAPGSFELLLSTTNHMLLVLGFIGTGILHIATRLIDCGDLASIANVFLALVYIAVALTHLFVGVTMIAWIAFAGIAVNLLINAYLMLK